MFSDERVDLLILKALATNEEYARKVLPFLKADYFDNPAEKIVFEHQDKHYAKYNSGLDREALAVQINQDKRVKESLLVPAIEVAKKLTPLKNISTKWLVDKTEEFCKDRALYLAVLQSIDIIDGKNKEHTKGALPAILSAALGVTFDSNVGLDYLGDLGARYAFYHTTEKRIPFKLKMLNQVTRGGVPPKTLNVIMAGTNVGKSMFLCDWAAHCLLNGYNALYVTAEMADMRIAERVDANILGVTLDSIGDIEEQEFLKKLNKVKHSVTGRLIIKEYPTATANAGHIRNLLDELKLKQDFVPDIVFIDYLNIFCSERFKQYSDSSYAYVKAIAEEMRGLAVIYNVPVVTATQVNRSGYSDSDMELDQTSESWGVPSTADFFMALIATEALTDLGQQMVKQLKSRYGNPNKNKRFVVGVDMDRQRYYDLDDGKQLTGQSAVLMAEKQVSSETIANKFFKKTKHSKNLKLLKVK